MSTRTKSIVAMALFWLIASQASALAAADRWQYATLVATGTLSWRTADRVLTATTVQQFPAFYKELTGQPWNGKVDLGDQAVAILLDAVGAQGWELVQVHTENNGPRVYYFKRRAS
ncbi:hypothetical protein BH09PLA1_BH09PLA1_00890 [soil metagenome]